MFTGMLFIFLPLFMGFFIKVRQAHWLDKINNVTSYIIFVILFLMGISIANLDNLGDNLLTIIKIAATFFAFLALFNLVALYLLDKKWAVATQFGTRSLPLLTMLKESIKLIGVVFLGGAVGYLFSYDFSWVNTASELTLMLLLLLIGIQLSNSGMSLKQIFINKQGMAIALSVTLSSWVAGLIGAMVLNMPWNYGLALSSGFGWYSLSGILIGDHLGPIYGGASFILELSREIAALMLIPVLIQRLPLTAIGYAGATAMDFTLPVIQTTGGVKCVPIAIVSGFLLSLAVPVFILLFVSL